MQCSDKLPYLPGQLDSVTIDGKTYTLDQTDSVPFEYRGPSIAPGESLTPFQKARTRANKVTIVCNSMQILSYGIGFFSANCFLSNFFECEVTYRNIEYRTLEHGYQAHKAEICKDERSYLEILNPRYPADAKLAGGRIIEVPEWHRIKIQVMEELLYCKFRQHKTLYYRLLNTRPNNLFECTLCVFWGTGCKLGSIMLEERS